MSCTLIWLLLCCSAKYKTQNFTPDMQCRSRGFDRFVTPSLVFAWSCLSKTHTYWHLHVLTQVRSCRPSGREKWRNSYLKLKLNDANITQFKGPLIWGEALDSVCAGKDRMNWICLENKKKTNKKMLEKPHMYDGLYMQTVCVCF